MPIDKSLLTGSTTTLILKLLEGSDMYGYQMIETLALQSEEAFNLKAGTLYPLLHNLEKKGMVGSYDKEENGTRTRIYYHLTVKGKKLLQEKQQEWITYTTAVNKILNGGFNYATI